MSPVTTVTSNVYSAVGNGQRPPVPPVGTVVRASDVPDAPPDHAWLVEDIWREAGVGIVGGPPKGLKTWTVAELAVSVASGTPFLGIHNVKSSGPVLAYFAEDSLPDIKLRLNALCANRDVDLKSLHIDLIDANQLLLNHSGHIKWLDEQVRQAKPRLLILDPFVRLFRGNEDDAGQVAAVLGHLRRLQREHGTAVLLVHHVRKGASSTSGATLRGSGDLHAFGDSNLYLTPTRTGSRIVVEHRSARAPAPFTVGLTLLEHGGVAGLELVEDADDDDDAGAEAPLEDRVTKCLTEANAALGLTDMQQLLRVGRTRLSRRLKEMEDAGDLDRDGTKFRLRSVPGEG